MVTPPPLPSLDVLNPLEASIGPLVVRQFLAAQRWGLLKEKSGIAELWGSPEAEQRTINILLPLDSSYTDFNRRFRDAIHDLSEYFDQPEAVLIERITAISTDLFFVRLDQSSIDGTISLGQASSLMESLQRMIRAAATTVSSPTHTHKGRRPQQVIDFLRNDLRLGHTRRGSFIITVAARLHVPELSSQAEIDHGPAESLVQPLPYSRRVMEALASGIETTSQFSKEDLAVPDISAALERGVSLELVQSLLDISDNEGLSAVDFSFQWAESQAPAGNSTANVRIESSDIPKIERFRDQLIRRETPMLQTLVGRVAALGRDERPGRETTSIILEADVEGRMRKIRVFLAPQDYDWAIRAHRTRLLLTVTGRLVKKRGWEIEGDAQVDTSQLAEFLSRREEDSS